MFFFIIPEECTENLMSSMISFMSRCLQWYKRGPLIYALIAVTKNTITGGVLARAESRT